MEVGPLFLVVVACAVAFGLLDGFHSSGVIVAPAVSSRVIHPRMALALAAAAELIGPFLFGTAVAKTIGDGLVARAAVSVPIVIAATVAAILWKLVTWWLGFPSSASHALSGGVIGAVVAASGFGALKLDGLRLIALGLLLSPLVGLLAGYLFTGLTWLVTRGASMKVNRVFQSGQIATLISLALVHGSHDAQLVMGILALGLIALRPEATFATPPWVILLAAGSLAVGTLFGGQRIMRTLGASFYRIRPVHGFSAQAAGTATILAATVLGAPISTTQVASSSIVGAGAAERLSKVRWLVFRDIVLAWLVTIPAAALLAALLYYPLSRGVGWLD
jgi:PiT family inorganic phosphate transporter